MVQQHNSPLDPLIVKVSRSHAIRHTYKHAVESTWTSDQPFIRGRHLNSKHETRTSMPLSVYEPVSQQQSGCRATP